MITDLKNLNVTSRRYHDIDGDEAREDKEEDDLEDAGLEEDDGDGIEEDGLTDDEGLEE